MANFALDKVYIVDILERMAGHDPNPNKDVIMCRMLIPAHNEGFAREEAETHMINFYAGDNKHFLYTYVRGTAPEYMKG